MKNRYLGFFISVISSTIILELVGVLKLNAIFGTKIAFFSGLNSLAPIMGFYGGLPLMILVLGIRTITRNWFTLASLINPLSWYLPTLAASWYWRSSNIVIRLCVPVVCMVLFMVHPVGSQSFVYSFFWLIPVALYSIPQQSIFGQALGSTFVAHAVGSVLWLYFLPTTPAFWYALLPVVAVERLFFATGMVLVVKITTILNCAYHTSPVSSLLSLTRFVK